MITCKQLRDYLDDYLATYADAIFVISDAVGNETTLSKLTDVVTIRGSRRYGSIDGEITPGTYITREPSMETLTVPTAVRL